MKTFCRRSQAALKLLQRVKIARTVDAKALDVKTFLRQLSLAHALMSICGFLAAKQAEKHRAFLIIHHRLPRDLMPPSLAGGTGALAARQLRAHRQRHGPLREDVLAPVVIGARVYQHLRILGRKAG